MRELKEYLISKKLKLEDTTIDDYIANEDNLTIDELDDWEIDNLIYSLYNVESEYFEEIVYDLLPLCAIAKSEITDIVYRGFGTGNFWLLKQKVKC